MEQIVSEPETEFDLLGGSSAPRPRVAERLYLANERIRAAGAGPRERRYTAEARHDHRKLQSRTEMGILFTG